MSTLVARGVRASYADVPVLHGVDLTVGPGDVVGLVGANGAGKSTLLRILAGEAVPDSGTVTATGTIGHLAQEPDRHPDETLLDALARRTGVGPAQAAMEAASDDLAGGGDGVGYAEALDRWLALGGGDFDARAAEVLHDLGLQPDLLSLGTGALSGGQLARASLAAVLLSQVDVLLLDEPTNNLDLHGLARLEAYVGARAARGSGQGQGSRGGLVVVSHDREFLARTVTSVLELDAANGRSRRYDGGWDSYLAERETERRHSRESYDEYADRRSALVGQMQSAREMSVRGSIRAQRRSKDPDKSVRAYRIESATSAAGKVRSLETRVRRLDEDAVAEPRKEWVLRLELPSAPRSGEVVATLRSAAVRRGDFTLGPVDLDLRGGDRVAIAGPNGAGKTTLLALILGRQSPESGSATTGSGLVIGELDQTRALFETPSTLVQILREQADLPPEEARTLLAKFGLRAAHVGRPSSSLSPGERTRGALALLMARGTNCLVLDEPTNHLDLPAIEQVEEALATYAGTLLLVTHDRRLQDAVSVTRTLQVQGGRVTEC
ncbi:MAG: ABC-F family ATP-binding cassette domain-containing protein [Mycobacteriales bacterium]